MGDLVFNTPELLLLFADELQQADVALMIGINRESRTTIETVIYREPAFGTPPYKEEKFELLTQTLDGNVELRKLVRSLVVTHMPSALVVRALELCPQLSYLHWCPLVRFSGRSDRLTELHGRLLNISLEKLDTLELHPDSKPAAEATFLRALLQGCNSLRRVCVSTGYEGMMMVAMSAGTSIVDLMLREGEASDFGWMARGQWEAVFNQFSRLQRLRLVGTLAINVRAIEALPARLQDVHLEGLASIEAVDYVLQSLLDPAWLPELQDLPYIEIRHCELAAWASGTRTRLRNLSGPIIPHFDEKARAAVQALRKRGLRVSEARVDVLCDFGRQAVQSESELGDSDEDMAVVILD